MKNLIHNINLTITAILRKAWAFVVRFVDVRTYVPVCGVVTSGGGCCEYSNR